MRRRVLLDVFSAFDREVSRLRTQFESYFAAPHRGYWLGPEPAGQAATLIRLHDAWARYCRSLVLLSARGNVLTLRGTLLSRPPTVQRQQRPLDALKACYPFQVQRRYLWEPRWYEPTHAINAARLLQIGNLATVGAGLGLTQPIPGVNLGSPEDLRLVRNYLAHRGQVSSDALVTLRQRLGVSARLPPDAFPKVRIPGGATLFAAWCLDLRTRAYQAAQ